MSDLSLIMTATGSIVLLLFLVMKARLHAVVSLILVSMVAGLAAGMNPADIAATIQKGMGGTLGFVAVVVALGAMFGKVMEVTGALDRVAHTLLGKFGVKRANWAMALTGFVCALPLFFDVAVVLLIGVAFAIVRRGGGSVVKIGIALLAGIATCQAFLIPAPGPILVFSVQKEILIKSMQFIQQGFAGDHEGSQNTGNISRQPVGLAPCEFFSRVSPGNRFLKRPVGIQYFCSGQSDIRMPVHEGNRFPDSIRLHDRVGIEIDDAAAAAQRQSLIIGGGKTAISFIHHQLDVGEKLTDIVRALIG